MTLILPAYPLTKQPFYFAGATVGELKGTFSCLWTPFFFVTLALSITAPLQKEKLERKGS